MADTVVDKQLKYKRVFLNNIDKYTSKYIAKFLESDAVDAADGDDADGQMDEDQLEENEKIALQIVGTVSSPIEETHGFVAEIHNDLKREELLSLLKTCEVIIYDVTQEGGIAEAKWAVTALYEETDTFDAPKMFILCSTIMTWAMSKPVDKNDLDVPFTEENYRKRKSHWNFQDHIGLEKLVVKLGKSKRSMFSTYVVASGLQYGMEEHVFHHFFKMSWLGDVCPIYGDATNIVPTIHIRDLAGIIRNVIDEKPKLQYFLAVDDSKHTLEEIVKAISLVLGSGKTMNVPKEEIYLIRELTQRELDSLFVNLRFEATFLKEMFNIKWVSEAGMIENMEQIIKEYKINAGLLPLRICVLGPPAVGKTTIAAKMCKHYRLPHVKLQDTITETLSNLESIVSTEDPEIDTNEAQEHLDSLKENMEQNGGRLEDQDLISIIQDKLKSKPCMNQGFVLDGFPKTYEDAKKLFNNDDEESEEPKCNFLPEFVIALSASDDFLKERVMNLPECLVEGTSYTPERFILRLACYRARNVDDKTVLNMFEELEILPECVEITTDDEHEIMLLMKDIYKKVGKPRNYRRNAEEEEEEEERKRLAEQKLLREAEEKAEAERRDSEEAHQRDQLWDQWNQRLLEMKRQEQEELESQAAPMKNYLMKSVMSTVTQGLIECCTLRPDDPVEFLAEYLLKNSPPEDPVSSESGSA